MSTEQLNPGHLKMRSFFRYAGPIVSVIGLVMVVIAFVSFFSSFAAFESGVDEPPRYFWCGFVGLPLIFVGMVLSSFGYAGAVMRYHAAEVAPVAKDVTNYIAEETQEGIQTVAKAVATGLHQGANEASAQACTNCGTKNDSSAKFCDECGTKLA